MRGAGAIVLAFPTLLAAAGCGGESPGTVHAGLPDASGARSAVAAMDREGRPVFAMRVDGDVTDLQRMEVFEGQDGFLAMTGFAAGDDQCRLLLLSPAGALIASHRIEGNSPFPSGPDRGPSPSRPHRQLQRPLPGTARVVQAAGRRLLCVATEGLWSPHAVEVLEVLPGRLVPRLQVWNRGSFCHFATRGNLLAVLGLANGFPPADGRPYGVGVGLVDLEVLLAGARDGPPRVARFPTADDAGAGYRWYALLPESHGVDDSQVLPPEFEAARLRVPMERGEEYRIDLEDGGGAPPSVRIFRPGPEPGR
jgi:hypothetical protein